MADENKVLRKLLQLGFFDEEDAKVRGIAKRSIAEGFDSLTAAQKHVLDSWLIRQCDGHTALAGELHKYHVELEGATLANALEKATTDVRCAKVVLIRSRNTNVSWTG